MRSLTVFVVLLALALLRSAVLGQGWVGQGVVNNPDSTSSDQQPCIAIDQSGTPWVAWDGFKGNSTQLFAIWNGNGWTAERGVGPNGPGVVCRLRPSLAFDDRDVAWLAWDNANRDNTDDIGSSFWADTCWTPEIQVNLPDSTDLDFAPKVACGGGQVWCVWYGGPTSTSSYSVFASRWDSSAGAWEPETQVSPPDGNNHWWCDVAVDSEGTPHVVWTETEHVAIYYSFYNGLQWSGPFLVNDSSRVRAASWAAPRIVIDNEDVLHVCYTGVLLGTSRRDVFYTRNDGSGWVPSVRVTQDTAYNYQEWFSDIAANGLDNVWVVWDRETEGPDQFGVYASHYDGAKWSAEDRLDNDSADDDAEPGVCLDGFGEPWVVWAGRQPGSYMDIYYNRRVGVGVSEAVGPTRAVSGILHCAALAGADPIRMTYRLRAPSRVSLAVYDMLGRPVATLVNRTESEGEHVALWHARVPNGPYFCRLNAGEITETSKIVVTGRR